MIIEPYQPAAHTCHENPHDVVERGRDRRLAQNSQFPENPDYDAAKCQALYKNLRETALLAQAQLGTRMPREQAIALIDSLINKIDKVLQRCANGQLTKDQLTELRQRRQDLENAKLSLENSPNPFVDAAKILGAIILAIILMPVKSLLSPSW
ncbi:MAG: hypothetical protein HEQ39_15885 [Rhizobacter sp.]